MFSEFRRDVIEVLKEVVPNAKETDLVEPPEGMGELGYPCFSIAKTKKINPDDAAADLAEELDATKTKLVADVQPFGPYINFFIDWAVFGPKVIENILRQRERYGQTKTFRDKVMVEFAQPNTHKAFHVGHVRNIALGSVLCNILETSGSTVIRANYQGDIGPHVAKCLWGLLNLGLKEPERDKGKWLGTVYAEASRRVRENEELEQQITEITKKLYAEDPQLTPLWKKTRQWSLDYFDQIYKDFGVVFDRLYFESEAAKLGKEFAQELLKKGIARLDNGATIADLKQENLGVVVLVTTEGYPLYSAKELGLASARFKTVRADRYVIQTANEQTLHFKQFVSILSKYKPEWAGRIVHIPYELVNLPSGKMASRSGNVVSYEELLSELTEKAYKETKKRRTEWDEGRLRATAKSIALAAIKYSMLRVDNNRVIVFDWERALSLQGDTGPYLQYTYARASSILKKAGAKPKIPKESSFTEPAEKKLLLLASKLPDTIVNASRTMKVNVVTNYCYDLAVAFNDFYEKCPVLQSESSVRESRLALVSAARQTLRNTLHVLGIDSLEEM